MLAASADLPPAAGRRGGRPRGRAAVQAADRQRGGDRARLPWPAADRASHPATTWPVSNSGSDQHARRSISLDAFVELAHPAPRRSRQARVWGEHVTRRRRRADARAVDDQHRHRRRRGTAIQVPSWRAPAPSWCASRSTRPRRRPPCRTSASGSTDGRRRAAGRRLPLQRPSPADRRSRRARRRWPSTASTPATSARAASATSSSRR